MRPDVAADSEPEPDFAVVLARDYSRAHPTTAALVIEIAGSSLTLDRTVKAEIYAQASVPEYWVVDLAGGVVEVFDRSERGRFTRHRTFRRGDSIRPAARPRITIAVGAILWKRRRG